MAYKVVFDIAEAGYRTWTLPAFGLPFILIGALLLKFHKYLPAWPIKSVKFKKWFALFFLVFSILWTSGTFFATFLEYRSLLSAMTTGNYQISEGIVTDFVPMSPNGHSYESFTVDGKNFQYSDYVPTAGFNNTRSHGGPIRPGLKVRILHVGNAIIGLEVAE